MTSPSVSTTAAPREGAVSREKLLELYTAMLKVRMVEEKVVSNYPQQEMRCPTHLSIGQEAAAAGVCVALDKDDAALSTHRCHGHYLAKGGSIPGLFAELYGRVTGCAKGKGGSMHLLDVEQGFMGASAIVGGTIPMGAGLAWAFQLKGLDRVAVAFFGDGATEEGVFHESLSFAALRKLPVIFVCENNFYATHSHVSVRRPVDNIFRQGEVYGIRGERVDGTDVVAVYQAAERAVQQCRRGEGPVLLEIKAYRWKEHVGPNFDHALGYRTKEELDQWMDKCPIKLHEERLTRSGLATAAELQAIRSGIAEEIEKAVAFAKASPFPSAEELTTDVTDDRR